MVRSNYPLLDLGSSLKKGDIFASAAERDAMVKTCIEVYRRRPFVNTGGMNFATALAYATFLQRIQPTLVIESGIWRGFSTWWIEQFLPPETAIICLDPVLIMPINFGQVYRSPHAAYSTHDFSCISLEIGTQDRACAIFDDHQNALPRLEQAWGMGIPYVLYDDNLSEPTYHRTFTHAIQDRDPLIPTLFSLIEEYWVFPPLLGSPPGCPLDPLYETIPSFLQEFLEELNDPTELGYTWVTLITTQSP